MTFNALGIKIKGTEQTLAAKLGIELPEADKAKTLEAKVLDTENLAEVVVEFSNADLVDNKDALLNPANYTFNDSDIKVQHVEQDGDKVVLHLTPFGKLDSANKATPLRKGKKYDLTIRNIDKAINKKYTNVLANDNTLPSVEKVEFIGTHGIKVTTNEPIANLQERNFRLDSRTSMIVEQYGREIILTPYHKKEFAKDKVELTVDELVDFAGYKSVKTVETMTVSEDEALPKVTAAYRKGNVVVVEFDRDVYLDSIEARSNRLNLGNISFRESRVDVYAKDAKKVDTNVVEYTFEREVPKGAEVVIEGVANHFNKAMEKETRVVSEFKDNHMPYVISHTEKLTISSEEDARLVKKAKDEKKEVAKVLDAGFVVDTMIAKNDERTNKNGKMTITFDKDLEIFKNEKDAKAYLNGKDAGKTVERIYDYITVYELDVTNRGKAAAADVKVIVEEVKKDAIVLSFTNIKLNNKDRDYDYVLEVRNFRDLTGNRMDVAYLDFQVARFNDAFNITKAEVVKERNYFNREGVEIVLEFNAYVNKEEASNARNYYLDGKLDVDEAIVERDGKTVSLVVYDTTKAKFLKDYKVLEVSPRVTKLDSTTTVANRFWGFDADGKGYHANDPSVKPEVTNITYINAKTPGYVTEVTSGDIATTAGVTVEHKTANDFNYKVVAFKGIDQLPAATKEGKGTLTVMLDDLGFTSANIDKEDYKVLVKVYKEETKDKKDYKLVEEKEIYTNDIVAANVSFKTLAGKDAVAGKVSKVTVSTNTGLAVETAEKTAVFNTKTIKLVMDSTNSQTEDVVVTDDGSSNYTLTLKSSDSSTTTVTLETVVNTINDIKVSGEQVFNATVATANKATAAQAETLTFDNLGETPVVAEPIVLNLESTKAIKPATNISFILDGKTVNAKVEVSTNGKALKVTEMKYVVSGEAVKKADFSGETITEIVGLETVDVVKISVNVTGM